MAQKLGGRWVIEGQLGEGGQAHTFKVRDEHDGGDTRYALKRLKNVKRLDRFKKEVSILRSLTHSNVVRLIDFNLEHDPPYFVSELCSGGDLSHYPDRFMDKPIDALNTFIEVCHGVAAAHNVGVIHRDIKPANILFRSPEGPVVVADFGIAYVEDGERQTLTEEVVGARHFIAPELESGRADSVTVKSDVYSLGKLLYWMISGGRIFSREMHRETNYDLFKTTRILPPQERYLLEHVNLLLDRAITADLSRRFSSVTDLIWEAQNIRYHIQRNHNPLSPIAQICKYCGQESYKLVVDQEAQGSAAVHNFGFNQVSGPSPWRILRCPKCGHIELFKITPWWGPSLGF